MKIAITGSASHLARVLLPRLFEDPAVERIVGVDLNASGFDHPKYTEHRVDVRDAALGECLTDIDAVVHMAFVVLRSNLGRRRMDRELVRDINVNGSINVFNQAAKAGVNSIVHLSSAAVYGAWPDNPLLMDEEQPRRAMPGFSYAEDKVAVEDWLDRFEAEQPALRVVRLRPHVILGPCGQPLLRRLLMQPFYPRLPDPQPLTQCVWEDDVADAIIKALFSRSRGSYNLGTLPALPFKEMLQRINKRTVPMPMSLMCTAHRALWRVSGIGEEPGWLEGMRFSLAVDCDKAHRELGWRPALNTEDCLRKLCGDTHGRRDSV